MIPTSTWEQQRLAWGTAAISRHAEGRYLFLVPTGLWRINFQNLVQGLLGQEKAVSWYLVLLEVSWYLVPLADHETSRAAKFGKSCNLWVKNQWARVELLPQAVYRGSVGFKNKEEVVLFEGKFLLPSTQSVWGGNALIHIDATWKWQIWWNSTSIYYQSVEEVRMENWPLEGESRLGNSPHLRGCTWNRRCCLFLDIWHRCDKMTLRRAYSMTSNMLEG